MSLENCHVQFSNFWQFETNTLAIDIKLKTTQFDQSFNNLPFYTLIDLLAPTFFLYHNCHGTFICIRLSEIGRYANRLELLKRAAYKRLLKAKAHRFKQLLQDKMQSSADRSLKEWWALLWDLRTNAKWEDPDQHVQMADLTSFFRSLHEDPTLEEDAKSDPNLKFSCSEYFTSNLPLESDKDGP